MKRLFLFLSFFLSMSCLAQTSPYKYLKMDNGEIVFERIYELSGISKERIGDILSKSTPKVSRFSEYRRDGETITGRLIDLAIDYRKHGHTKMNTPIILNDPISGNVTIEWKDGKYKVTISGILFKERTMGNSDIPLKSFVTKKKGTEWKDGHNALQIGEYTEEYLNGIFKFSDNNDW